MRNGGARLTALAALGAALWVVACGGRPDVAYKELVDDDPAVRVDAAMRLGQARAVDAVDSLLAVVHDPDDAVRIEVIRALGEIGDRRATAVVASMADDDLSGVRLAITQSLGLLKDPAGIPALTRLLRDEDDSVRISAARALGMIEDDKAMEILLDAALQDEWEWVRQHVVIVIANRKYKAAVPKLERMLSAEADKVRAHAAGVLGEVGDASSVPVLIRSLEDPFYKVRSMAAHALARLAPDDARVRDALVRRLEVEDIPMTRVDLAWALVKTGDRSAIETVRKLLFEGQPEDVRAEAAMALGDVGDAEDIPWLEKALGDKKGLVRKEAQDSLQKLRKS